MSDTPIAGYYKTRMVRSGIMCPVRVWYGPSFDPATGEWCDRPHRWRACIAGEQVEIGRVWPYCARHPITEAEYRYMRARQTHAKMHEPGLPESNPTLPINLGASALVY
jgi:hypothetical protein